MKKMLFSVFWVVTVAVNSGTTSVNVSMPDNSFDSLLNTIQSLANNASIWGSNFLTQLFQLI